MTDPVFDLEPIDASLRIYSYALILANSVVTLIPEYFLASRKQQIEKIMLSRTWLITGCSTGFGRELAFAALSRGDKVIATARDESKLQQLEEAGAEAVRLDVRESPEHLKEVAAHFHTSYGQLDILVNNAGYVAQGSLEEISPAETQAQFETNVFGLLNVTRAFLPLFRSQRSGTIANISSVGAWRGTAGIGAYSASKWAVSAISETLTLELADFGIRVCCIEPGFFRSNFLNPGHRLKTQGGIADYDGTVARTTAERWDAVDNHQPGDVSKAAQVITDVLTQTGSAVGREIPQRLVLGSDAFKIINEKCSGTIELLKQWESITKSTDYEITHS